MMTKVPLFLGTYKPAFCELLGLISRRSHLNIMRLSQEIQIGVLNPFFLSSILDRGDREIDVTSIMVNKMTVYRSYCDW